MAELDVPHLGILVTACQLSAHLPLQNQLLPLVDLLLFVKVGCLQFLVGRERLVSFRLRGNSRALEYRQPPDTHDLTLPPHDVDLCEDLQHLGLLHRQLLQLLLCGDSGRGSSEFREQGHARLPRVVRSAGPDQGPRPQEGGVHCPFVFWCQQHYTGTQRPSAHSHSASADPPSRGWKTFRKKKTAPVPHTDR